MFKRFKRSAKKLREFAERLLYPNTGAEGADKTVVDPLIIKAQIPRSHFTRKGPGVARAARRVFAGFTAPQQHYACSRGWFPKSWEPQRWSKKSVVMIREREKGGHHERIFDHALPDSSWFWRKRIRS